MPRASDSPDIVSFAKGRVETHLDGKFISLPLEFGTDPQGDHWVRVSGEPWRLLAPTTTDG